MANCSIKGYEDGVKPFVDQTFLVLLKFILSGDNMQIKSLLNCIQLGYKRFNSHVCVSANDCFTGLTMESIEKVHVFVYRENIFRCQNGNVG